MAAPSPVRAGPRPAPECSPAANHDEHEYDVRARGCVVNDVAPAPGRTPQEGCLLPTYAERSPFAYTEEGAQCRGKTEGPGM